MLKEHDVVFFTAAAVACLALLKSVLIIIFEQRQRNIAMNYSADIEKEQKSMIHFNVGTSNPSRRSITQIISAMKQNCESQWTLRIALPLQTNGAADETQRKPADPQIAISP
jgi:hypothetical protein